MRNEVVFPGPFEGNVTRVRYTYNTQGLPVTIRHESISGSVRHSEEDSPETGSHQRGQTRYYVSSGLGIWGAKFRIGTQSEYIVAAIQ
jgi:hypothetical protein